MVTDNDTSSLKSIEMSPEEYEIAVAKIYIKHINIYLYYYLAKKLGRLLKFGACTTFHFVEDDYMDYMIHPTLVKECDINLKRSIDFHFDQLTWNENTKEHKICAIVVNTKRFISEYRKYMKRYGIDKFRYNVKYFSLFEFGIFYVKNLEITMKNVICNLENSKDIAFDYDNSLNDPYVVEVLRDLEALFNNHIHACNITSNYYINPNRIAKDDNSDQEIFNNLLYNHMLIDMLMGFIPKFIRDNNIEKEFRRKVLIVNIFDEERFAAVHETQEELISTFLAYFYNNTVNYRNPLEEVKSCQLLLSAYKDGCLKSKNSWISLLGAVEVFAHEIRHFMQHLDIVDKYLKSDDVILVEEIKGLDMTKKMKELLTPYPESDLIIEEDAYAYAITFSDALYHEIINSSSDAIDEEKIDNGLGGTMLMIIGYKWDELRMSGLNVNWLQVLHKYQSNKILKNFKGININRDFIMRKDVEETP